MSSADGSFQIFIALPTDDVCTVKGLSREMFVYELKSRVELKAGIPGDTFNLFFMNAQLLEKGTLKSYNLKHGCIIRVKIEANWMGLFEACWRGDIYDVFENGVQFLDEEKFQEYNISLWNKLVIQRATFALFIACHRGYLGLILELINRGATNINGKTIFGRSALHVASYQGFVGCVALLLSEGAICNQIDIQGKTPLALASENGHVYCERRLWLYQWNMQTFRQPQRSWSPESSEPGKNGVRPNGKYSPQVTKLPSSRRPLEELDSNNNVNEEQSKVSHLHLPLVSNNDDQRRIRRCKSSNPSSFPLMQIAEKYRKELREYNERTLNLPVRAENGSKEVKREDVQAPLLSTVPSKDEVEIMKDANTVRESGLEVRSPGSQETIDVSNEEKEGRKKDSGKTREQAQTNLDAEEASIREQERSVSGRAGGIRKLDILMSESRVERMSSREQGERFHANANRKETGENEQEEEETSALIDIRQELSCKKPTQTFETWLQMKRNQEKHRPCTAPAQKSRLGKSMDPEAFKKWMDSKRYQRMHSNSESVTSSKKTPAFISSGGLTFDRWLETKLTNRPLSAMGYVTESRDTSSGISKVRKREISGKPFQLWLAEKKKMDQSIHNGDNNSEQNKNSSRSGITFEVWLQEKRKQKQIELVQKITTEKEQERLAELDQLQKWLNPRYKTYDDWLAIKNQEAILERMRAHNEPHKQQDDIPAKEKQKDAKVVYEIWQTMKALQDLSDEEKKYEEMRAKWEAKKREKEKLRRLNIVNRAKKLNFTSTSEKS